MSFLPGGGNGARLAARFRGWRSSWTAFDAVRFAITAILFTSAALKTHQLATESVASASLVESRWFLVGVVEFELFLSLWLASGLFCLVASYATVATFVVFACATLSKGLNGAATCGCFGRISTSPWLVFTLDITVVAVLAVAVIPHARLAHYLQTNHLVAIHSSSARRRRDRYGWITLRPVLGLIGTWIAIGLPVGLLTLLYGRASDPTAVVQIQPGDLVVGNRFPLDTYIDIGDQLTRGNWTVVFYRHDCRDCDAVLQEWSSSGAFVPPGVTIAFVSVPPHGSAALESETLYSPTQGYLSDRVSWVISTPLIVGLHDGNIVGVFKEIAQSVDFAVNRNTS